MASKRTLAIEECGTKFSGCGWSQKLDGPGRSEWLRAEKHRCPKCNKSTQLRDLLMERELGKMFRGL